MNNIKKTWLAAVLLCLLEGCSSAPEQPTRIVLPSCLNRPMVLLVTESNGWLEQVRNLPGLKPEQIVSVSTLPSGAANDSSFATPWTTDQWILGWRAGRPLMLNIPGERRLCEWGLDYATKKGWSSTELGTVRNFPEGRFDAGGNVLVVPASNKHVCVITSSQIQRPLKEYLQQQTAGDLIELDTRWLKVGHVDEIVSIVPANPGEQDASFRLVLPDYQAGLRLLQTVPAEAVLFAGQNSQSRVGIVGAAGARFIEDETQTFNDGKWKYVRIISGKQAGLVAQVRQITERRLTIENCWDLRGSSPTSTQNNMREGRCETMPIWFEPPEKGSQYLLIENSLMWVDGQGAEVPSFITAGELLHDDALIEIAKFCAQRIEGPGGVQEILCSKLRLQPKDIIRLPTLVRGCDNNDTIGENIEGLKATALVPNPVNLVCLDNQVVLLKPHGPRSDPKDEASDVFLSAWRAAFVTAHLEPAFLEGWDALHRLEGGAHCGINVLRKP